MENNLPMQEQYEGFYNMAAKNELFSRYCEDVFGIDFSQDGFSDIEQINDIIRLADIKSGYKVLDIGCGNGRMAEYIADKTGAALYGFDYSKNAIDSAAARTIGKENLHFEVGAIGEKQYPAEEFDVIISVDTMYFAPDMEQFAGQIREWLKLGGIFITYYSEFPFEGISADENSTKLALALLKNKLSYKVIDYTKAHYELMTKKRRVVVNMKEMFIDSNLEFYYTNIFNQSMDPETDYKDFIKGFNRRLYIAQKNN